MQSNADRHPCSELEPNKKLKTVRTLDQAGGLVDINKVFPSSVTMRVTYSALLEDECNSNSQKNKHKIFSGNVKIIHCSEVPAGHFANEIEG
jgi:hypothetical protein